MSIETAVVVGLDGSPIQWHLPAGRTGGSIPCTMDLYWVMLQNMEELAGVAHSHPGRGRPVPSGEDLTTFSACRQAFGPLTWWICTEDQVLAFRWTGPGKLDYGVHIEPDRSMQKQWLRKLREHSYNNTPDGGSS